MNAPQPAHAFEFDDLAPTGRSEGASRSVGSAAPVVVIGGGPAGIRTAQELARRGIDGVLFNAERWQPYNRVKLTPLLAGEVRLDQISQSLAFAGQGHISLYSDQSIIDIDRDQKVVTGSTGRQWRYSKVVICTGSRAHIPPIVGRELPGVFTFRNFDDVEKLLARAFRSRRAVVIGGGLLGLEAARGMAGRGIETWVFEHETHLMTRQLDARAGELLAARIEALGLAVRTGRQVARIVGSERVEGLETADGETVACDTVIICTGVRPNMELARDVGLAVGRGIRVSASMQTSDPDIYAVGECAEFEGHIYGLVGPGFEQALVAAASIAGEAASYAGSVPATKLKMIGADVFSMGDVEQLANRSDISQASYETKDGNYYRKLVLRRGRLAGAMALGDWSEINRLQEAVRARAIIWPWQRLRFIVTGRIWADRKPASVREWPRAATVCNCTGVTRGQIGDAIALGCQSLADVKRDTGASTVCGSCGPLIGELLGAAPVRSPAKLYRPIAALSAVAALLALVTSLAPPWPVAANIAARGLADLLWLDGFWKQVSGYTLLALCAIAAVLSLRKRSAWLRLGDFSGWRLVHIGVGAAVLAAVFAHTGLRIGSNLNMWLMLSLLGVCLAGAATGLATALEHRLLASAGQAARLRSVSFWLHLLAFWPLPLLLAAHVLTVYFY